MVDFTIERSTVPMKFTILHRHTDDSWHTPEYDISMENRILPEYRCEFSFIELFNFMCDSVDFIESKIMGDFIIPANFLEDDYLPAVKHIRDEDGNIIDTKVRRDDTGKPYVGRLADNVVELCMLPLDYDGGITIEEAKEKFKDYEYILYSSYRHLLDGVTHKFRMLIPYEVPLTNEQYTTRKKAILEWLGGKDEIDTSCLSRSRGFYMPSFGKHNAANVVLEHHDGKRLDGLAFEEVIPEPYTPSDFETTDKEKAEVYELLQTTIVDTYDAWWWMVQDLKSIGFTQNEVLSLTVNNPYHNSRSTGLKSANLTRDTYGKMTHNARAMGRLVVLIRKTYPEFKASKKAKVLQTKKSRLQELQDKIGGR